MRQLGLVSFLVTILMASEVGAEALFSREFAAGDSPSSVAIADLDGDSVPDLVTANVLSHDVSVLLGNGDGSFQAAVAFAAGGRPISVAVADLDGDGVSDLVTANVLSDDVSVLLGNGDGSFQATVSFAAGNYPRSVAAADFDGDTVPDLVTANRKSWNVTVLLNLCDPAACPEIDIKPGSDSNPINPVGRGKIPVAILGSETFDVTDVDVTTLAFGPAAASPAHDLSKPAVFEDHLQDVNRDGFTDLLSHYRSQNTGIMAGSASACLRATTLGGAHFGACVAITTRDPRGPPR
jgi:hypothetical protein